MHNNFTPFKYVCANAFILIHTLHKYIAMHGPGHPEEVPRIHGRHDSMHQNPGRSPETTRAPGHEAKAVVPRMHGCRHSMHQNPGRSPETTRAPGHEAKAIVPRIHGGCDSMHQILEEVLNQHGHQVTKLRLSCYLHVSYK